MRVLTLLLAGMLMVGAPTIAVSAAEAKKGELYLPIAKTVAVTPPVTQTAATPPCRVICPKTGACLRR